MRKAWRVELNSAAEQGTDRGTSRPAALCSAARANAATRHMWLSIRLPFLRSLFPSYPSPALLMKCKHVCTFVLHA